MAISLKLDLRASCGSFVEAGENDDDIIVVTSEQVLDG